MSYVFPLMLPMDHERMIRKRLAGNQYMQADREEARERQRQLEAAIALLKQAQEKPNDNSRTTGSE